MKLRLLGPLEVVVGGESVPLGPPKQRLLLALLANRAGRMVTTDELVEDLWSGAPPASAAANLRSYVHGLRRVLGPDAVTGHGRPGYVLSVPAGAIDVEDFLAAARQAEEALAGGQVAVARSVLHRALGLWRGRAFEGLDDVAALRTAASRLEDRRLVGLERRIDADLYAGAAGELTAELTELVATHPYRERFHAQLMVALHRSGRQADALAAYRAAQELLSRDLGIEPGAELRELELAILRGDATTAWTLDAPREEPEVIPSELPVAVSRFACRDAELARLDALAAGAGGSGPIAAIVGPGGVGKTALTVYWAHRVVSRFPDGQLFVDLRGFHPERPVGPADALARMLRALGVAADRVPPDHDEAAALYRSLLSGRRVLVVLDNAGSADQVRPLLPAGPGCMTLVTSRNSMTGLVAQENAEHIALRPMSVAEGVRLLSGVLPPDRLDDEPDAAGALVEACGGLPLALRITAANLAAQDGRRIAEHVDELNSGGRLDRLLNPGDEHQSVRAAFDLSYAALADPPRTLFALLGLVPGADVTAEAAAALCGGTVRDTERHLEQLAATHLVERSRPGRYALHDLAREYARERADTGAGQAALDRLLAHYSEQVDSAAHVLFSQFLRLTPEPPPTGRFDRAAAVEWLRAELPNLVAAVDHAAEHGPYEYAWLIADALRGFCQYQGNTTDWAALARSAAVAADRARHPKARAAAAISLAHCRYTTRDYAGALTYLERALDLSQRAGWPEAEASVMGNLAATYGLLGQLDRAVEYQRTALEINRRVGFRRGETVVLSSLGCVLMWRGELAEAEAHLAQALELLYKDGAAPTLAVTQSYLIGVLLVTGRYPEAAELIEEATGYSREAGRVTSEIPLLIHRADLHRLTGDPAAALACATEALEMVGRIGDRLLATSARLSLGDALAALGRAGEAVVHHRAALKLATDTNGRYMQTEALVALSTSLRAVGDPAAGETARTALAQARAGGFRIVEGQALQSLARIADGCGARDEAADYAKQALAVADSTGWAADRDELDRMTG